MIYEKTSEENKGRHRMKSKTLFIITLCSFIRILCCGIQNFGGMLKPCVFVNCFKLGVGV